ncbi:MAG: rhodanese-like domain-containing protein [Cyanobacteria bacterium J06639_1]
MQTLPYALKPNASAVEQLKWRLNWGEPALTIVDVRDRELFRSERISGAVSMPMDELVASASSTFEAIRDIYIYGESEEQATQAASLLSDAGFESVISIPGGLKAWKGVSGSVEGINA